MRLTAINREERYQHLMQAALRVFARDGIDGASVAQIAEQAGIAKGSVYLFFDSKEALAGELVRYLFSYGDDGEATLRHEPEPLARVLRFCEAQQKMVASLNSESSILLHMLGHAGKSRNDALGRGIRQLVAESRFMIQALLDNARGRGMLPPEVDTARGAATVLACAYGTMYQHLATPDAHPQGLPVRDAVRTVLAGLGARL
jgi:TetR/AcrR family fatty acid metabolism transcriptional regulator